jgi:hypothetical protein
MADKLSSRPLEEPHWSRVGFDDPRRAEILAAHRWALSAGEAGCTDPATGLFVFTAAYLVGRRACCDSGCRHCPYLD